jgi:hypothetical protein
VAVVHDPVLRDAHKPPRLIPLYALRARDGRTLQRAVDVRELAGVVVVAHLGAELVEVNSQQQIRPGIGSVVAVAGRQHGVEAVCEVHEAVRGVRLRQIGGGGRLGAEPRFRRQMVGVVHQGSVARLWPESWRQRAKG